MKKFLIVALLALSVCPAFAQTGQLPARGIWANNTGAKAPAQGLATATGILNWFVTPSSANLATAVTDETGSGALVFGTSPAFTTPTFATSAIGTSSNATCFALGQNGATNPTIKVDCSSQLVTLGAAGAVAGGLVFANATSGSITISPPAGALGTRVLTLPAATDTLAGQAIANGGTGGSLTASNGGVVYSDSTRLQILAGTASAGLCLLSNSNSAPAWGSCSGGAAVADVSNSDGSLTISPTTGSVVASLNVGHANSWTAAQTFDSSAAKIKGSSTGVTSIASANAGATNYTATLPALTGTIGITVASGTKALATGAISSGSCTAAQTSTATGTLTTDTVQATFSADPTSTTGYSASTSGMLTIIAYPTADTVNFKVCNNTMSSITPGAITLNWRVAR